MSEQQKEKQVRLRLYEVSASAVMADGTKVSLGTFLVDAPGREAARRHVAQKFVGEATMPNGQRVAELMSGGATVETVTYGGV